VIADITLLALGTSAPQISLAIIDAVQQLGQKTSSGLGPGTLVGSAAFNLYPILAVCVLVPKAGSVKRIQQVGVWIVELVWSIWAYIWLAIILQVSSPNVVEPWEAVCTVLQFPILMRHAYVQDIGWRALLPSGSSSWKRLGSFNAEQSSNPSVYLEQGKPEWELVELQHQRTLKEATSVDTQISPSEHQLVSIAINGNDHVTSGDDKTLVNNQEFVKLQSSNEHYEQTSTWASIRLLWKQQYCDTIFIKSRVDETGKELKPTAADCISYLITFPWRVVFAFLPPPALWHGWPAFLCALAYITVIANFLIKLATQFGCVTGVPDYALALTVLAIGTSWPDLIASKIAAEHQPTADSAIANINARPVPCPFSLVTVSNNLLEPFHLW
jgi:magnesium/proton exchanger